MHVVIFGDQHILSSGGAQVSMRLQRQFLEAAGHVVTVVGPRMHAGDGAAVTDPAYVDTPSVPITLDREYSLSLPGRRTDAFVDRALEARPPVDVVHVQADFWGAFSGHRFARRHGLPVVHTMHNRVDVGMRAVTPLATPVLGVLNAWRRRVMPGEPAQGRDGWAYLRGIAGGAAAVTAPSSHFAEKLEQHDVVGAQTGGVDVIWNGIDDAILDAALHAPRPARSGPPRFVWVGRMSPEKRLLPFLSAVAESGMRAEVEIIGGGGQLAAARRLVRDRRPIADISFAGRLSYAETLRRIAAADAVVQTSVGFETQGMTVFEAAALGTPAVVCDPDIAAELESGYWAGGGDDVSALAAALRRASCDIAVDAAMPVNPSIAERFRQSSRTAAMIDVYERVRTTRRR